MILRTWVLASGRHVLIEKPLSLSLTGVDQLIAAPKWIKDLFNSYAIAAQTITVFIPDTPIELSPQDKVISKFKKDDPKILAQSPK